MSFASKFGRAMLEKYGWAEGKGLGKKEDGMSKPIQVNGNMRGWGLGHDVGSEFHNQWWDHVYNKTANNMSIEKAEDGSLQVIQKEDTEVNQKMIPYIRSSIHQYSSFVKGDAQTSAPKEMDMSLNLSYDKLFEICGGRTAHKGARHGLTMSAKLARVKKQEEELMRKWQNSEGRSSETKDENFGKSKKSKKVKDKMDADVNDTFDDTLESIEHKNLPERKKNKKYRKAEMEANIDSYEKVFDGVSNIDPTGDDIENMKNKLSKKERKRLLKLSADLSIDKEVDNITIDSGAERKKKRKTGGEKLNSVELTKSNSDPLVKSFGTVSNMDIENMSKKERKRLLKLTKMSTDNEIGDIVSESGEKVKKKKRKSGEEQFNSVGHIESYPDPFGKPSNVISNMDIKNLESSANEKERKKLKKLAHNINIDEETNDIATDSGVEVKKKKKKKKREDVDDKLNSEEPLLMTEVDGKEEQMKDFKESGKRKEKKKKNSKQEMCVM